MTLLRHCLADETPERDLARADELTGDNGIASVLRTAMPSRTAPTAFRFDPAVKAALALISEREGRSMANMMEWLIRKHCEREGLGWPASKVESQPPARPAAKRKPGAK